MQVPAQLHEDMSERLQGIVLVFHVHAAETQFFQPLFVGFVF